MAVKPEKDYEPVFRSQAVQADADEVWPSSGKFTSFDNQDAASPSPTTEQTPASASALTKTARWLRQRGHSLTFCCLFVFSIVLYLRPYELFPALSSLTSMAFYSGLITLIVFAITQLTLEGNFTARPREINLILLIGLAALFSIPLAINPGEAWEDFSELLIKAILIFIVIVNVVRSKNRLYWLLLLALGVSVYLSINAILDYQSGVFGVGKAINNDLRIAGRIKGLFENSNDLALHLVTMVPIAVALAFAHRGAIPKIVYLPIALLMIGGIVVTFSRGGFLGLLAVAIVLVIKLGRGNRFNATAGLVLAMVLFFAVAPGDYGGRLLTIFDTASDITGSSSQRNQVLQRSVLVALRYPLTGVGLGNFHHKSFQELGSHNAYTQVASEMGIPAMIFYMMFLIYPYKKLKEIEKRTYGQKDERFYYYLSVGLGASLFGYMVASFFAAVAYQWYVYYLVGYAIAMRRIYAAHAQQQLSNVSNDVAR
ncbi:MAG TPA: O-antigen ligase family protein [Pyrinomonadaceae bacterium]|nr:O-antigen ligase family protein [Pyrinomonadaceae bacterium]